jgi:hypothetical protein
MVKRPMPLFLFIFAFFSFYAFHGRLHSKKADAFFFSF